MHSRAPVLNKADMYRRLSAGEFGSTIPQYFSLVQWWFEAPKLPVWGVRTLTPGGPCRLNCPREEVATTFAQFATEGHKANISMMVDVLATVTAWLEVWDSPSGLVVEGIEYPKTPEWTWRNSMPDPTRRKRWEGVMSRTILRRHMSADSYDDLMTLLDLYPDHIVEFSTLDRCLGSIAGRNAVIWEVRRY